MQLPGEFCAVVVLAANGTTLSCSALTTPVLRFNYSVVNKIQRLVQQLVDLRGLEPLTSTVRL